MYVHLSLLLSFNNRFCMFSCQYCFYLLHSSVRSFVSVAFNNYTKRYMIMCQYCFYLLHSSVCSCVSFAFNYYTVMYVYVSVLLSLTSQIDMIMSMLLSLTTLLCMFRCQFCFQLLHNYLLPFFTLKLFMLI